MLASRPVKVAVVTTTVRDDVTSPLHKAPVVLLEAHAAVALARDPHLTWDRMKWGDSMHTGQG